MTQFTIYGKSNNKCKFCDKAKDFLDERNIDYVFKDIEQSDGDKQFVISTWEDMEIYTPTVPLIIDNRSNAVVGGYDELTKWFGA